MRFGISTDSVRQYQRVGVLWALMLMLMPAVALFGQDLDQLLDDDDNSDEFLAGIEKDEQAVALELLGNSFLGNLRYWNGVDANDLTGWERAKRQKDGPGEIAKTWGWRYNTREGRIAPIPGRKTPISAVLRIPDDGKYRLWLRYRAELNRSLPTKLRITGENHLDHTFGECVLTGARGKEQEKQKPVRFEDEVVRQTFPSGKCRIWEYWDVDLKKGDCLFEILPGANEAEVSHLFISACQSFVPRLNRDNHKVEQPYDPSCTLPRVFYRFRVRGAGVDEYRFSRAALKYHWRFDPKREGGEGHWGAAMGQKSLSGRNSPLPASRSGGTEIPGDEWTEWLDASWSTQGAGPWATGVLALNRVQKGECDIQLAWHPHPAAVVKTITARVDDGEAKFCVPLINRGRGMVVYPGRRGQDGIWGVFGKQYLERFKTIEGFYEQYRQWVREGREKLGIARQAAMPSGIRLIASVSGTPAEQRLLGKILVDMGFNCIWNLPPQTCEELGLEPAFLLSAGCHASETADPARPLLVRQYFEKLLEEGQKKYPDYANQVRFVVVGDEIGFILGSYKVNHSTACLRRFRQYLAEVLREKGETPSYFGVESLEDLACVGELDSRNPGVFERRLYYHSLRFKEKMTAEYYRSVTAAVKEVFPKALTYANYSPAPLRQGDQTMNHGGWFHNLREGGLSLAWGEDWCYRICSFTGYEIVSYYAALTECAARKHRLPSGFYNVPNAGRPDTNIISMLSRGIRNINLYTFGPLYNATSQEGAWSDNRRAYPVILKALHVASFVGRHLAEGTIEKRRVALLYNRDHEIMNGGRHGEQSDRALTFAALGNCHRNADIILNEDLTPEILTQYSVLFINGACFPKAAVPVVKEWVQNGGLLIAAANAASRDEYNSPLPEMEEIYGAKQLGTEKTFGYFDPIKTFHRHEPLDQITVEETPFTPALTAEVIGMKTTLKRTTAQPVAAFEDGSCAATLNQLGKGYALLWGIQPGIIYKGNTREGHRYQMSNYVDERLALFEKPIRQILGESPLACDAKQVELTRFELDGETALLLNNFDRQNWKPGLPPMRIRIKLNRDDKVKGVTSAMHGELGWEQEGERLTINSPVPATSDSIVIEQF